MMPVSKRDAFQPVVVAEEYKMRVSGTDLRTDRQLHRKNRLNCPAPDCETH